MSTQWLGWIGQYRKKIWKLNVPPKVRTFLWQACSNILPTRGNLHRRKLQVEPRCEFCCQSTESIEHVLWECSFARNVWALCRGKIQKCQNAAQDFFFLFRMMVDRLNQEELEQWGRCPGQSGTRVINSTLKKSNGI